MTDSFAGVSVITTMVMGGHGRSARVLLLPHLGSRLIVGWLYNGAGASVLIAGQFHSMHDAIVNSTGLVAVVGLPQFDVLVIMAAWSSSLVRSSPSPREGADKSR